MVKNGTVRNFALDGVDLRDVEDAVIESVRAHGNGAIGLQVGKGGSVRDSTASSNADGIVTGESALVENCTARSSEWWFPSRPECHPRCSCSGYDNSDGIEGTGCVVIDCSIWNNSSIGIRIISDGVVRSCTATSNGGDGIGGGNGSLIKDCVAAGNQEDGIQASENCQILDCTARDNSIHGISLEFGGSRVERNVVQGNGDRGIRATGGKNLIVGNFAVA